MTEDQYRAVCDACDRLLLAADASEERVAIPWLHVIREHPTFVAAYNDVLAPRSDGQQGNVMMRGFRRGAWWMRQFARVVVSRGRPWFASRPLPSAVDVLFVSHVVSVSQAGASTDAYFGRLPIELAQQGFSTAIALMNHTTRSAVSLAAKWVAQEVPRVVLSASLPLRDEIRMHRRMSQEARRLAHIARRASTGLDQRVARRAATEAMSSQTAAALRVARQLERLVLRLRPGSLVITHEGHSWERIGMAAARRASPSIRCIAYQHATLFRLQHAIRRNLASVYNPDVILTSGSAAKTQLGRAGKLAHIRIEVLGSDRAIQSTRAPIASAGPRACLVLPEGISSECLLLFDFSLACARDCPDVLFVWRLHPILAFEKLRAANPSFGNLPPNVELSTKSLDEDIARCHWAVYRGTTAIVKAVGGGLRPLYVASEGEMSIDPLYDLKEWKVVLRATTDFRAVVKDSKDDVSSMQAAQRYCEELLQPFTPHVLRDIITKS